MSAAKTATATQDTKPAAPAAAPKEPKNMATAIDSKLSFSELQKKLEEAKKLQEELSTLIAAKRGEEIKVLADGYAKKAAAAGFTPQEAIDALMPYLPAKAARAARKSAAPKEAKEKVDLDKSGASPVEGKTYKLDRDKTYFKKKGGRTAGDAIKFIKEGGFTWAERAVK